VINPATGKPFATCPRASAADLEAAVKSSTKAFSKWRATPIDERRAALRKAGDLIMANADAIASLFTKEQGRPAHLAKDEILGAGYWFHSTAELDLPVDVTEDTADRRVEVHHVPLGVVCGIVPWNFPVLLASMEDRARTAHRQYDLVHEAVAVHTAVHAEDCRAAARTCFRRAC
jgi:acyl-CoA reductase-like NAD-dependent aldehyde dehydrogenase